MIVVNAARWADALVEYVAVNRVITKLEATAMSKLMSNQKLSEKDAYTLLWCLETHPTTRLDTLDLEDFVTFVRQNHQCQIRVGV